MGSANRGGTQKREAHGNRRRCASLLRTTQRYCFAAKTRLRDRATVARTTSRLSWPTLVGASTEVRVDGLIRTKQSEPLIVSKIMKLFIRIVISVIWAASLVD